MSKLQKIRREAIEAIKALLAKYGLEQIDAVDIDEGCSPVVRRNPDNDDMTFTLDRVVLKDGKLLFDASSCFDNATFDEDSISTDALADIQEWLEENEETIARIAEETREDEDAGQGENDSIGTGKYILTVIYGEHAAKCAVEDFEGTLKDINDGRLEGSYGEYEFDSERDRDLAIEILSDHDGWLGSDCKKS